MALLEQINFKLQIRTSLCLQELLRQFTIKLNHSMPNLPLIRFYSSQVLHNTQYPQPTGIYVQQYVNHERFQ